MILKNLKKHTFSPYAAGTGIGLVFLFSYIAFEHTLGSSVSFVKISAFLHQLINKEALSQNPYYLDYLKTLSWIDWQVALVIGVFVGAYLSLKLSKKKDPFCSSKSLSKKSRILSLIGGFLVIFGARFAGGCTSGHVISGGIQLAASGYLFMIAVFLTAIPTAFIARKLFKKDYL